MQEKMAFSIMLMDHDTSDLIEVCRLGDRYPAGFDFEGEGELDFDNYVREPEAWDSFEIGYEIRRVARSCLVKNEKRKF